MRQNQISQVQRLQISLRHFQHWNRFILFLILILITTIISKTSLCSAYNQTLVPVPTSFQNRWIMIRSIEFRAMNTSVMLAAEGEGAIAGMYVAKTFIDECEQRFSRFLPASELSDLNRSTGEWIQISDDLMDMLQLSMKYHIETNGIFDPSILSDLKQIGYDRSMDEIRANGVPAFRLAFQTGPHDLPSTKSALTWRITESVCHAAWKLISVGSPKAGSWKKPRSCSINM